MMKYDNVFQVNTHLVALATYNNGKADSTTDFFIGGPVTDIRNGNAYYALWHTRGKPVPEGPEISRYMRAALFFPNEQAARAYATQYVVWLDGDRDSLPPRTDALGYWALLNPPKVDEPITIV